MNQEKIGKFIAERRKEKCLTQAELAEKFSISDRAVSKWENGKSLPDASIMIELCNTLGITVNELLSGEMVNTADYKDKAEQTLVAIKGHSDTIQKKQEILKYILGIILVACIVLGLRVVCSRPENEAVAALGKHYTKEALYVNDGWTDGSHAYKYNYSKVALDTDGVLKVMTDASKTELLGYIDNFESWIKKDTDAERVKKYTFNKSIISNDDYLYIKDSSWGGNKYSGYDVYYFDTQSKVLYLFHCDI